MHGRERRIASRLEKIRDPLSWKKGEDQQTSKAARVSKTKLMGSQGRKMREGRMPLKSARGDGRDDFRTKKPGVRDTGREAAIYPDNGKQFLAWSCGANSSL